MLLLTFPNCLGQDLLFAGSGSYARLASFQGFSCLHQSCCRHAGITDACYLADCGCGEGEGLRSSFSPSSKYLTHWAISLHGSIVLRRVPAAVRKYHDQRKQPGEERVYLTSL